MSGVYTWLKTVVIFMIFLTILSNLLGKSDFKKYVNVVTGLLLMLVTMNPLLKIISGEEGFEYYFESVSFDLQTTEVANEMKDAQEAQRKVILKKYKEEIKEQIEDLLKKEDLYLVDAKIEVEEDMESEDYARLKTISLVAAYQEQEEESNIIRRVEIPEIDIGAIGESKVESKQEEDFLSPVEIKVKNTLSDFYNIKADNINISIQGG